MILVFRIDEPDVRVPCHVHAILSIGRAWNRTLCAVVRVADFPGISWTQFWVAITSQSTIELRLLFLNAPVFGIVRSQGNDSVQALSEGALKSPQFQLHQLASSVRLIGRPTNSLG
jgi:hypothetical protein